MTETIQTLKEDIAILQEKLQKLEELQRTKSPVDEAYKRVYGYFPTEPNWDDDEVRWESFQKGYNASQKDYKVGEYQPTPQEPEDNEWTIEKLQEKNWYVDTKTNLKSHWEPKPQTPEQIEKSLKEAFVKAQQTEEWKETQRKIDSNYDDKNFKNSLDLIKEWGEKNKPPTLYEILMEWWINHLDMEQSDEEIVDGLVNIIGEKFIPPSSDRNGYEWEKCLKMMKVKLR